MRLEEESQIYESKKLAILPQILEERKYKLLGIGLEVYWGPGEDGYEGFWVSCLKEGQLGEYLE